VLVGAVLLCALLSGITSFALQVNGSMWTYRAAMEIEGRVGSGEDLPEAVSRRDFWGRPFVYVKRGTCFALVSLGLDGVPDRPDYSTVLCSGVTLPRRSSCWWPNTDTIFVRGEDVQACSKNR